LSSVLAVRATCTGTASARCVAVDASEPKAGYKLITGSWCSRVYNKPTAAISTPTRVQRRFDTKIFPYGGSNFKKMCLIRDVTLGIGGGHLLTHSAVSSSVTMRRGRINGLFSSRLSLSCSLGDFVLLLICHTGSYQCAWFSSSARHGACGSAFRDFPFDRSGTSSCAIREGPERAIAPSFGLRG